MNGKGAGGLQRNEIRGVGGLGITNINTTKNAMNVDMLEELERYNDAVAGTPLFLNKQKKYVTVTRKMPQAAAILDRKSISTFSAKGDQLKPTLNGTQQQYMSATKTHQEDNASDEQAGHSSYYANFSPTGFDKLQRTGIMLPTLDSPSPLRHHNQTHFQKLDSLQLKEVVMKPKIKVNDSQSIKAGESVIQGIDDMMTSSKAFNVVESQK